MEKVTQNDVFVSRLCPFHQIDTFVYKSEFYKLIKLTRGKYRIVRDEKNSIEEIIKCS